MTLCKLDKTERTIVCLVVQSVRRKIGVFYNTKCVLHLFYFYNVSKLFTFVNKIRIVFYHGIKCSVNIKIFI